MAKQQHDITLRHLNTLFNLGAVGALTDGELLKLFTSRRDQAAELAFAVLVERHGPMVLRVCQAVLRDSHDAQDAFQATFLVLVQKARGIWVRECLGPWLHQVAHRTASCARAAKARRRHHERLAASPSVNLGAGDTLDDLREVLNEEVARLPERYRAAVVLCLLEGLTPDRAARQLGWPAGTVHSCLARGRARLRDRLSRRGLAPEIGGLDSVLTAETAVVPAPLIAATGMAVTRFAAGEKLAGIVSASIVALTKEGLKTQMITKMTVAGVGTLALGVVVAATGALGYQTASKDGAALPRSQSRETSQVSGKPSILPHKQPVTQERTGTVRNAFSLAISSDGNTLAAACTDSSVHLLAARTGEKRVDLVDVPRGYIRGLVFAPDGKTIWGVCDDNRLRLWDVGSGRSTKEFTALRDMQQVQQVGGVFPNSLALSPDGGLIAVGGGGSTVQSGASGINDMVFEIRVLDTKTSKLVWSHLGRRGYLHQLSFSPDGNTLACATYGEVRLWDARVGDLKQTLKPKSGDIWSLAFSPDSKLLAGYGNGRVEERRVSCLTLWDLRSSAIVRSIEAGQAHGATAPGTLAFSPDGKLLASADVGVKEWRRSIAGRVATGVKTINHVKLWDVARGTLLWTSAEGDLGHVKSLVFSPDGGSLFCCDESATTRIDARTGQIRQDLMMATEGSLR
jgi:RNA polymerase sigma factor (sigma-70 family)